MPPVVLAALLVPPALAASWLLLLAWRIVLARRGRPSWHAWTPAVVLVLPLLAITCVIALTLVPLQHDDGHAPHAVVDAASLGALADPLAALALAAAGAVALRIGAFLRRASRHRREMARALAGARVVMAGRHPVYLADLGAPNAHCAGWLRGRVVMDAAWWRCLRPSERRIVVEHEAAHARRRDALVAALLSAAGIAAPKAILAPLARAWRGWAEIAADRAAAQHCGDPRAVARLLLREHRRLGAARGRVIELPAFGGGSMLELRIRALLDGSAPASALRPDLGATSLFVLALIAALPLAAPGHVHGIAEFLLGITH